MPLAASVTAMYLAAGGEGEGRERSAATATKTVMHDGKDESCTRACAKISYCCYQSQRPLADDKQEHVYYNSARGV